MEKFATSRRVFILLTKHKHGGSRKGAGRKPSTEKEAYIRVSFYLPPDCVEWLKKMGRSQSETLAQLIRKEIEVK